MTTSIGTLGIMVSRKKGSPPFSDREFLKQLCLSARRLELQAYVFCADSYELSDSLKRDRFKSIKGYAVQDHEWIEGFFPVPELIFDRCLSGNAREAQHAAAVVQEAEQTQRILWSRRLPGKWRVYERLKQCPHLSAALPLTLRYTGPASLRNALHRFQGDVFMKPSAGSHGSHTLYIHQEGAHAVLKGRTRDNVPFRHRTHAASLPGWISQFTGHRSFVMQPFLQLTSADGRPFDIRVLVQKNGQGRWCLTGSALREGSCEGLTSNLHGGGRAAQVLPGLISRFGSAASAGIMDTIHHLSELIPPDLEEGFGRLGELGIDFGVDAKGTVWLLEVNSKPGRRVFTQTGDTGAAEQSVMNPLRYARYLLLRQLRRVNP
ncbi:hypothetical protein E6C60_2876 [Paenibacillus algicola]|uniref:ATP-grasp domain-containing protein n=1 Tax=Paenibacillus algicola TaxID=2565926 RepID=A0A4P8XLC8_9BACL|nr:YheC/YheD family protein [Paenibacillus algicola]QCT03587.1 hypothetical protein E6C60_2876 [Paenibacillus algicola]